MGVKRKQPENRPKGANGLTGKAIKFCQLYPTEFNATQAAKDAGYSAKTAYSAGQRLLKNVEIQNKIKEFVGQASEKALVSVSEVVGGLRKQGFYDVRKFFSADGTMKDLHELDDVTADAVEGFEFVNLYEGEGEQKHCFGQLRKIKLAKKVASRQLLGRYLGMFQDEQAKGPLSKALIVEVLTEGQMTRVAVSSVAGSGEEKEE